MADAVEKSVSPKRDEMQDNPVAEGTVESLQAKLADAEAKLAERNRLLQQDHSKAAAEQTKAVKLPNSDLSLTDMSFDQLCKIFPRPEHFSSCSQNVSILDWLKSTSDWMKNVHLLPDSWERIAAGCLSERDFTSYQDHLRHLKLEDAQLTWEMLCSFVNSTYGDTDPDASGMRELLAVSQKNRSVGEYIADFQKALAEISPAGVPTERIQIFYFLDFMDDSLAEAVSVNPHSLKPWDSLVEVIQAARHVDSGTKRGVQFQSQSARPANSGQKRARGQARVSSGAPLSKRSSNSHSVEKEQCFDLVLNETELSKLQQLSNRTISCGLTCKQDATVVDSSSASASF